jgi:hypothetical protein
VAFSQISPGGPWVTAGGCVFEERAQPLPRAVTAASPAAACAALGPSRRRRSGDDISGVFMFSSARLDLWFAILKTFHVQTRRAVFDFYKVSANQLVILFHNTKLIKRRADFRRRRE